MLLSFHFYLSSCLFPSLFSTGICFLIDFTFSSQIDLELAYKTRGESCAVHVVLNQEKVALFCSCLKLKYIHIKKWDKVTGQT